MSKIKIAELFYSIQGEGRYMGVPSVFLRTFGCNFKCAGFGMPRGQLSTEAEDIARTHKEIETFFKYEDLPLVSTGCDSYASWHPDFKELSPMLTSDAKRQRRQCGHRARGPTRGPVDHRLALVRCHLAAKRGGRRNRSGGWRARAPGSRHRLAGEQTRTLGRTPAGGRDRVGGLVHQTGTR